LVGFLCIASYLHGLSEEERQHIMTKMMDQEVKARTQELLKDEQDKEVAVKFLEGKQNEMLSNLFQQAS